MTELDGFESRLLRALIEIDADGAGRLGPPAAAVEHRRTQARRKRRFPSRALVVPVVAVLMLAFGATAAASGLFAPAPPDVLRIFKKLPPGGREGHRFREGGQCRRYRRPRCLRGPDLERRFLSVLRARPTKRPNRHILHPARGTPWRGGVQRATRHRRRTAVRAGGR